MAWDAERILCLLPKVQIVIDKDGKWNKRILGLDPCAKQLILVRCIDVECALSERDGGN